MPPVEAEDVDEYDDYLYDEETKPSDNYYDDDYDDYEDDYYDDDDLPQN